MHEPHNRMERQTKISVTNPREVRASSRLNYSCPPAATQPRLSWAAAACDKMAGPRLIYINLIKRRPLQSIQATIFPE
jgi:hypothetical protein